VLTYIIEHVRGNSHSVQTTLHFEGGAVANDWEMMNRAAFDAMNRCDHLVVNIEKINRFDCSLLLLLCTIRRTAHLLGKEVTVQGNTQGDPICAYEYALRAKATPCTVASATPCHLWESLSGPVPHPLLEWW
jgi:ABC-type transporter Mla MlaB component